MKVACASVLIWISKGTFESAPFTDSSRMPKAERAILGPRNPRHRDFHRRHPRGVMAIVPGDGARGTETETSLLGATILLRDHSCHNVTGVGAAVLVV